MQREYLPLNATDLNIRQYVHNLFKGRAITIASMHSKEKAINPVISKFLPCTLNICPELNTDQFGTFTGEVIRESAITALRQKTRLAIRLAGGSLVIASEGSFGCHPLYSFLTVN